MKNKKYMILLYCLGFLVFCISTTALALLLYMPPDLTEAWEAEHWWEENRADMESSGLEASKPRILTTPMNGLNIHGERTVTDPNLPVSLVLSESWTPYKPENYHYIKISLFATGYGEVAFTLNGHTEDFSIGHWTSEPIQKAEREVYTYRRKVANGVVNPNLPAYDAAQISPTTVSISATGSAQTRSRRIVTYGSRQGAITAQAGSSGAGIGFVIGETSYWKWEAGITRNVDADTYDGGYSVTINDKIRGDCGVHRIDPSKAYQHRLIALPCGDDTHVGYLCIPASSDHSMLVHGYSGSFYECQPHTTGDCGHTYLLSNSSDHALLATCSNCNEASVYKCAGHPDSCTGSGSTPTPTPEPQSTTCANGHFYDPDKTSEYNKHRTRTCRYCSQTWERCGSGTPKCNKPWRKKKGYNCWARPE